MKGGGYLLTLKAQRNVKMEVGRLGLLSLPAGYYVYVGSALGPGGVEARVKRHLKLYGRKAGRLKWHVDWLLTSPRFTLVEALKIEGEGRVECLVSRRLEAAADWTVPGFGSSDCREGCKGHLHYFKRNPARRLRRLLEGLRLNWKALSLSPEASPRRFRWC